MKYINLVFLLAIIKVASLQGNVDDHSLSLTANTIHMEKATSYNININGKRAGLTYSWTSSNSDIVKVNSKNGIVNAVQSGEAFISCHITGLMGEKVTLTSGIIVGGDGAAPQLKKTKLELKVGEQFDINIANKIEKSKYKWISSDEAVISVKSSNGYVTALGSGEAKVTCTITAPDQNIFVLLAVIKVTKQPSNMIWEDDFNTDTLDHEKWDYEYGYVRNHELQSYTDSLNNVYLQEGYLVLKAIKDKKGAWTSASIQTNNKLEIGNARIEASIKLPYESGAFPAFWMLGADYEVDYKSQRGLGDSWLEAREIDIMEAFGKVRRVQGGVFIKESPGTTALSQFAGKSQDVDIRQFHTYAVEKRDDVILFYCDDRLYYSFTITDDGLNDPFYLLLNLAVGAAGGIPDPAISEMEMLVDYVRVTALEGTLVTEPQAISLDKEEYRGRIGEVIKLDVQLMPLTAQDRTITWISSDPSVATVHGGYVHIKKAGITIITALSANGIMATCKIICN